MMRPMAREAGVDRVALSDKSNIVKPGAAPGPAFSAPTE